MRKPYLVFDCDEECVSYTDDFMAALTLAFQTAGKSKSHSQIAVVLQPNSVALVCDNYAIVGAHRCLAPDYKERLHSLCVAGDLPYSLYEDWLLYDESRIL